jgi:anti-anti-sigma factor
MKRHQGMAPSPQSAGQRRPAESLAMQIRDACNERPPPASLDGANGTPRARITGGRAAHQRPAAKEHTLVLSGRLERASTLRLEAEIERLCDTGIARITLELSQLTAIDATGAAVIVFRGKWCRRRGCELALAGCTRGVQRALEQAGAPRALFAEQQEQDKRESAPAAREARTAIA